MSVPEHWSLRAASCSIINELSADTFLFCLVGTFLVEVLLDADAATTGAMARLDGDDNHVGDDDVVALADDAGFDCDDVDDGVAKRDLMPFSTELSVMKVAAMALLSSFS